MKYTISVLVGTLVFWTQVFGQSITLDNAARVQEIIDHAYEAHGGESHLDDLRTVVIEQSQTGYSIGQSRSTEPPWDRTSEKGYNAIDLVNRRFVRRFSGQSGAFEFDVSTIINGDDSAQIDFRSGTVASIAEPDFDTVSAAVIRVTPALLVRTLKERSSNAYYLGETTIDDVLMEIVGFSMTTGPALTLYFDKETHMLRRTERVFEGVGMVEYEYLDYENIDGIPFNKLFHLYLEGDPNLEREIHSVRVNEPIDDYLEINSRLNRVAVHGSDELSRQYRVGHWDR